MKKKLLHLIPFLLLAGLTLYALVEFMTTTYIMTWRHYVAFGLMAINAGLYFFTFRAALLGTGVILVLGTINLLSFFPVTNTYGLRIMGYNTPEIQLGMLFLLGGYFALNFTLFVEWWLDFKGVKPGS